MQTLAVVALLVSSLHAQVPSQKSDPGRRGFANSGFSANMAVAGPGGLQTGFAGRAGVFGDGGFWSDYSETPKIMGRLGIQGQFGYSNTRGREAGVYGAGARGGIGVWDGDRLYYGPTLSYDFDGATVNGHTRQGGVGFAGGELGFGRGTKDRAVFVGFNTGLALPSSRDRRLIDDPEVAGAKLRVDRTRTRAMMGVGLTGVGRFGEANKKGTTTFETSVCVIPGMGVRSDLSVECNVSDHIRVGGGFRQMALRDPELPALDIFVPAVKVTLGLSR